MKRNPNLGKYQSATGRWAGVGPYYAMFPVEFANQAVREFTSPGESILDPFAGRGTSLYAAAIQGRGAVGIEINPVGWIYAQAKLNPASHSEVVHRIEQIGELAKSYRKHVLRLPSFFKSCFAPRVREFLLAARSTLNWRHRKTDWTTMALVLVDLHGKRGTALSNQMRQTKSMSPEYAIRWWSERGLEPPDIDPVDFMIGKLAWRYKKGQFKATNCRVFLGDSRVLLQNLDGNLDIRGLARASLLLTSPPYFGVTNYFYDQWLRLWMLGGSDRPTSQQADCCRKFENRGGYESLLRSVFFKASRLLTKDAVVYVRTDSRRFTLETTRQVLVEAFPTKKIRQSRHSQPMYSQTRLFKNTALPSGEVDLMLW